MVHWGLCVMEGDALSKLRLLHSVLDTIIQPRGPTASPLVMVIWMLPQFATESLWVQNPYYLVSIDSPGASLRTKKKNKSYRCNWGFGGVRFHVFCSDCIGNDHWVTGPFIGSHAALRSCDFVHIIPRSVHACNAHPGISHQLWWSFRIHRTSVMLANLILLNSLHKMYGGGWNSATEWRLSEFIRCY